jgi:hypothetical protein
MEQILLRLHDLELRIARLELQSAAQGGFASTAHARAESLAAAGADCSPVCGTASRRATAPVAHAVPAAVSSEAAKTERLQPVPARAAPAADPFPDLSLLEEKLEPRKGPAQRVQVQAAIEDYPRIAQRIEQLWGTPECEHYLNTLVIDTRGNRQGFPPAVLEELLYLGRLARALVILQFGDDLWESYDHVGDRR